MIYVNNLSLKIQKDVILCILFLLELGRSGTQYTFVCAVKSSKIKACRGWATVYGRTDEWTRQRVCCLGAKYFDGIKRAGENDSYIMK